MPDGKESSSEPSDALIFVLTVQCGFLCSLFCLSAGMDNIITLAQDIDRMLSNALVISEYDRSVYVKRYGEERVSFIELQAEILAEPEHNIQACINIAYDKGFCDCVAMVQRILKRYDVQGVNAP